MERGMVSGPDQIDELVGRNIRLCRISRRIDLTEFAALIGASVEDVERYESGRLRVGAGRLTRIADALDLEVGAFFARTDELRCHLRTTSLRSHGHDNRNRSASRTVH
jgi:transcriptional regulator with XRE-family HTH domain